MSRTARHRTHDSCAPSWYSHPEANVLTGADIDIGAVNRFSELSLAAARPIEWHTHDETEVICCLKGVLRYEFTSSPDVTLTSGCFLVIPRGISHRLAGGVDGPCRRISVYLDRRLSRAARFTAFNEKEFRDLHADILKKRLRPKAFSSATGRDLRRIADLVARPKRTPRETIELRVLAFSTLFAFATDLPPALDKPQVRLMEESLHWLEQHYTERITIDQLVAYMGYGKSRFFTLFKELTGVTPIEWLIRLRIDRSCALLKESALSVVEISQRVGFDDPSFFARSFRRRMGLSPTAYRGR